MAVEYPYTTEAFIISLAGQLALDLRLDDSADAEADLEWAIDTGTVETDGYLANRYAESVLAENRWVQMHATYFAVRALCQRRLNDVPESIEKACERSEKALLKVQDRKAVVPRAAETRRPIAVCNYHVDLRRFNNTIRVVPSKTTGVAEDYRRAVDDLAPDDR